MFKFHLIQLAWLKARDFHLIQVASVDLISFLKALDFHMSQISFV
jgi:hypothetical protein